MSRAPTIVFAAVLVVLVLAHSTTAAPTPTLVHLLTKPFTIGVVTDTYGSFNSSLQMIASTQFDGALHGAAILSGNVEESRSAVPVKVEVDLTGPLQGDARLFFGASNADDAADIVFSFGFHTSTVQSSASSGPSSVTYWESTGRYSTNKISFGTYWWRFNSDHEFTLQFVDHVFTNTSTIHGFAIPDAKSSMEQEKPWYQSWGMVLVTLGVFLIKTWLGVINAKRAEKAERLNVSKQRAAAVAAAKKKN